MARVSTNMSLEPEVYQALGEFADGLGVNKSAACNLLLKAVLREDRTELVESMTNVLIQQDKTYEAEVLKEVMETV